MAQQYPKRLPGDANAQSVDNPKDLDCHKQSQRGTTKDDFDIDIFADIKTAPRESSSSVPLSRPKVAKIDVSMVHPDRQALLLNNDLYQAAMESKKRHMNEKETARLDYSNGQRADSQEMHRPSHDDVHRINEEVKRRILREASKQNDEEQALTKRKLPDRALIEDLPPSSRKQHAHEERVDHNSLYHQQGHESRVGIESPSQVFRIKGHSQNQSSHSERLRSSNHHSPGSHDRTRHSYRDEPGRRHSRQDDEYERSNYNASENFQREDLYERSRRTEEDRRRSIRRSSSSRYKDSTIVTPRSRYDSFEHSSRRDGRHYSSPVQAMSSEYGENCYRNEHSSDIRSRDTDCFRDHRERSSYYDHGRESHRSASYDYGRNISSRARIHRSRSPAREYRRDWSRRSPESREEYTGRGTQSGLGGGDISRHKSWRPARKDTSYGRTEYRRD